MKRVAILLMLISFFSFDGFAQEKTKKELKQERELQKQKEIEALINSKNFVFDAEKAYPQGTRMLNLDYNTYFIKFTSENVVCDLPFFGRAFNVGYGSDGGIKFEGKPENIKVEQKGKKYLIKTTVKGTNDVYDLLFTIFYDGGTSVSINSNNRASISYDGRIRVPKESETKK
ncbi:DUF4251 domain-containing protein [Flavobacterium pectinovorum]|uniref:DUF4251 domain-containing protein n=1 Tax=Flavobacterium pectinovorum TaxID=29533 RepID=UPI00265E4C2D|nr:DUF4251 domain-containing protein [Flavobacterium pectinovorum]WKL50069.1 DUF4251 domain-containing protein [Flavobacterium pectinovorum]